MIYKTIDTADQLREEFINIDRDYYSIDAYQAMINYFDDIDTNFELDVIALCCSFSEDTFKEFISNYSLENELKELCEDEEPTNDDYVEVISNYLDDKGFYSIYDETVFYSIYDETVFYEVF